MYKKAEEYVQGIVSNDRRVLAKAITLVESTYLPHQELSKKILDKLVLHIGGSIRIGITGVPGVGKSTFIENFGMMLVDNNYNLAVLTIDPSSSVSGGSIMADKTRMTKLSAHPNAFIRPSPSGGTLGGVSKMTREISIICEAAGFDVIIIETVGIGQSEVAVASMVDFFLVMMLAGAGDEFQGIKRGVLELADALAINKADGDNILKAEQARKIYESALHLLNPRSSNWSPPVLTCSSVTNIGLKEIWQKIMLHNRILTDTGELAEKRRGQSVDWMLSLIERGFKEYFFKNPDVDNEFLSITELVKSGKMLPTTGAEILLSSLRKYINH